MKLLHGLETLRSASERCLLCMCFCLPFSTALSVLFLYLGLISSLPLLRLNSFKFLFNNWALVCLILIFFWLLVSMTWSIAPLNEQLEGVSKYKKFLYVPLLILAFGPNRDFGKLLLKTFFGGCLFVLIGSTFTQTGLTEFILGPETVAGGGWSLGPPGSRPWFYIGSADNPTFGRNHITTSFFLVLFSNYCYSQLRDELRIAQSVAWGLLCVIGIMTVILLQSRGGYILVIVSIAAWIVISLRQKSKISGVYLLITALFCVALAHTLTDGRWLDRLQQTISEVDEYVDRRSIENSSAGGRLGFYETGLIAAEEKILIGYGVGAYAEIYSQIGPEGSLKSKRNQPHSEIINLLVQGGIVSLALYFAILSCLIRTAIVNSDHLLIVILLLFTLFSTVNSAIWDYSEGHLFVILAYYLCSSVSGKGVSLACHGSRCAK